MPPIKLSKISIPPAPGAGAVGLHATTGEAGDVTVEIPAELVERLWHAIDIVPGLTIETALTLALQQFVASLPADYEREGG